MAGETAILMADSYASESMIDNSIDVSGLEKMTDDYLWLSRVKYRVRVVFR